MSDWSRGPGMASEEDSSHSAWSLRVWPVVALLPVLMVGSVKATGVTSVGGVDATVLSVAVLLGISGGVFLRSPEYPVKQMLPLVIFALVVLLGAFRSEPGAYQMLKARDFFLLTGVIVVCIPVLIRDVRDLRSLLVVWLLGGTAAAGLVLLVGGSAGLSGRAGIGEATLGPAYLAASALVVGVSALGERIIPPALALPAITLSAVALVGIGSRGPMLGAVAGVGVWVLLRGLLSARTVVVVCVLAAVVFLGVQLAPDVATSRLLLFEDSARSALWATARTGFLASPVLGLGWGNYSMISWGEYPHNALLEASVELGIIGLASFAAILLAAFARVWRNRATPEVRALAALSAVSLVGQQLSSDLTNRVFWIAVVPLLLLPRVLGVASRSHRPRWPPSRSHSGPSNWPYVRQAIER